MTVEYVRGGQQLWGDHLQGALIVSRDIEQSVLDDSRARGSEEPTYARL
jgi:hypothetical protein